VTVEKTILLPIGADRCRWVPIGSDLVAAQPKLSEAIGIACRIEPKLSEVVARGLNRSYLRLWRGSSEAIRAIADCRFWPSKKLQKLSETFKKF
jgi:hypothetical protein